MKNYFKAAAFLALALAAGNLVAIGVTVALMKTSVGSLPSSVNTTVALLIAGFLAAWLIGKKGALVGLLAWCIESLFVCGLLFWIAESNDAAAGELLKIFYLFFKSGIVALVPAIVAGFAGAKLRERSLRPAKNDAAA